MTLRPLLFPLLLAGCASQAGGSGPGGVQAGRPFTLDPGQTVVLPAGGDLRYVGVRNDSRCPPGAQCIRAGDATVAFRYTAQGAAPSELELNTATAASAPIGSWRLQLLSLAFGDAPQATLQVDPQR